MLVGLLTVNPVFTRDNKALIIGGLNRNMLYTFRCSYNPAVLDLYVFGLVFHEASLHLSRKYRQTSPAQSHLGPKNNQKYYFPQHLCHTVLTGQKSYNS